MKRKLPKVPKMHWRMYQDELDTSERKKDEATEDLTDDPTQYTCIPRRELRYELDKETAEDEDEYISDYDEDHNPSENA